MLKKVLFGFTTAALAMASAASYNVSILQDSSVEGKQLKTGDYKVQLKDNSAILKHDKQLIEVPAHAEVAASKFSNTMVRYGKDGEIVEILVGGTTTKIVFGGAGASAAAGIQ